MYNRILTKKSFIYSCVLALFTSFIVLIGYILLTFEPMIYDPPINPSEIKNLSIEDKIKFFEGRMVVVSWPVYILELFKCGQFRWKMLRYFLLLFVTISTSNFVLLHLVGQKFSNKHSVKNLKNDIVSKDDP